MIVKRKIYVSHFHTSNLYYFKSICIIIDFNWNKGQARLLSNHSYIHVSKNQKVIVHLSCTLFHMAPVTYSSGKHFQRPHPDRATTRSSCKEFALICIKIALDFLNDPRNSPLILVTRIRILLQVRKGWVILLTACHATIIQMFTEGKRGLLSSPRTHG